MTTGDDDKRKSTRQLRRAYGAKSARELADYYNGWAADYEDHMSNVGYAHPARFSNPVALGTDGIGGNVIEAFRLAYVLQRSVDVTCGPDTAWGWLETGWQLMPEAREDEVTWSYDPMDPWHIAFTPGVRPIHVKVGGETVLEDGVPTKVDPVEVRAKAAEQARRLHARL